jgi:hypothetical protein
MLQGLAQRDQGDYVLLTEASWGPETRRRMVVDDGRAAEAGGARGGSYCKGGRGPWLV